jgi:hypothetical protein
MKINEITEAGKFATGSDRGDYSSFAGVDKMKRLQNISRAGIKLDPTTQGSLIGRASISDVDPEDQTGSQLLKKQSAADAEQRKKDQAKQDKINRDNEEYRKKQDFEKRKTDSELKQKAKANQATNSGFKKDKAGRTLRAKRYYGDKDKASALAKGVQGFVDPRNWKSGVEKFTDNPVDFISSKVDQISQYLNSRY